MEAHPEKIALKAYIAAGHFADADVAIARVKAEREQGVPTYNGPLRKRWFVEVIEEVGPRPLRAPLPLRAPRPMSDLDRRRAGLPVSNLPPMIDLTAVHCGWGR
jgi:hypothetical protein